MDWYLEMHQTKEQIKFRRSKRGRNSFAAIRSTHGEIRAANT
jgi:hypothetical protein